MQQDYNMNRYATTRRKVDKTGKRVFGTTYYPKLSIENSDSFITTQDGARLDSLAYKYYKDTTLWWVIAKANGIKGINSLKAGIILRIPGNINKIIKKFLEINKSG